VRGLARGKAVIIRVLTIPALAMLTGCSAAEQPLERLSAATPCETASQPDSDWRPGCATRRNLAALAENPRDLERPRQETPRDAMRRDAVISQYGQSRSTAPTAAASAPATAAKAQP
jgi:type IV pilus biogenesis protein CpaD/CtpE